MSRPRHSVTNLEELSEGYLLLILVRVVTRLLHILVERVSRWLERCVRVFISADLDSAAGDSSDDDLSICDAIVSQPPLLPDALVQEEILSRLSFEDDPWPLFQLRAINTAWRAYVEQRVEWSAWCLVMVSDEYYQSMVVSQRRHTQSRQERYMEEMSSIRRVLEENLIREEAAREAWQCKESAIAEAREIQNSAFVESEAILNNTRRGLEIGAGHCSCGVLLQESRDTAKEVVGQAWAEASILMEGAQRETLAANVVVDQIVECARVAAAEFQAQAQIELGVSRDARTTRGVASELVEFFSRKTARFDISTKKAVCEKFWAHPRLSDYHPASTGSAKLDRSVQQSFLGLKETLQKIKGAQRNDHRNAKHNSLVELAGNAMVQGRYQATLARALGIKRTNVYRAAKTRALLDSDDTTKFPTGQRRERSDKISEEVRAVVEAFWVAKSQVSPRMKDRVRRRISKGVYETNSAYWLEDTEVEDGLGGMNKNALEREQRKGIRGHKLEDAADAVQFLTSKFELDREMAYEHQQNARRFFWEVKVGEVDRSKELDCLPIKGTRSLHCFHGYTRSNPTLLRIKELSCFCAVCVDDEGVRCPAQAYTGKWKLESIHPIKPQDVIAFAEEIGSGVGQGVDWSEGSIAELIEVGDFFAVEVENAK
ncbi:hypothetical protein R1sor_003635 [Riccia sorocarpa]|uniref:F-box domain-containing protein n=1 Tax=Riccia sorocarpa TaxID=122646 RepID=A0ABD3H2Z6_9MARC